MNTTIEIAKNTFAALVNAPLSVSVATGLLAFGWLLKLVPGFPNQWIPSSVIVCGGIVGYFIVPTQGPADWSFQVANPEVADMIRRVGVGLAIGVSVFLAHKFAIKRLERWVQSKIGNGDPLLEDKK